MDLDVARPDGAHDAPRYGVWTYMYVKTTQDTGSDGKPRTHFTDLEDSSLGLEARGEYQADRRVGEWTFWHPNGKQRASGSFVDGHMSGAWTFWRSDGTVESSLSGVYSGNQRVAASER